MKKKIIWGVASIVALILIVVVFLGTRVDSIVRTAIETYGTAATKAETTLGNVDISITSGKGTLKNFELGNPEGFKTDKAMSFDEVMIEIDTSSLAGKGPIIIRQVLINAPEITYEVAQNGKTNLQTIQDNIRAYASTLTSGKKAPEEESDKEGRKLIIENMTISNGKVNLSHALLKGDALSVNMPTITMKNIGKEDKGGASPADVAQQVLGKISEKAIQIGQSSIVKNLREQGVKAIDDSGIKDTIGDLFGN